MDPTGMGHPILEKFNRSSISTPKTGSRWPPGTKRRLSNRRHLKLPSSNDNLVGLLKGGSSNETKSKEGVFNYLDGPMEVIVTIVSKLVGWFLTYLRDL